VIKSHFASGGPLAEADCVPILLDCGYVLTPQQARAVGLTACAVRAETPASLQGTSYTTRKLWTDGHR
jgi:hypothetical protein